MCPKHRLMVRTICSFPNPSSGMPLLTVRAGQCVKHPHTHNLVMEGNDCSSSIMRGSSGSYGSEGTGESGKVAKLPLQLMIPTPYLLPLCWESPAPLSYYQAGSGSRIQLHLISCLTSCCKGSTRIKKKEEERKSRQTAACLSVGGPSIDSLTTTRTSSTIRTILTVRIKKCTGK
jgi:hypothetical protein